MTITVEAVVKAKLNAIWEAWNNPADIKQRYTSLASQAPNRVHPTGSWPASGQIPAIRKEAMQASLSRRCFAQ